MDVSTKIMDVHLTHWAGDFCQVSIPLSTLLVLGVDVYLFLFFLPISLTLILYIFYTFTLHNLLLMSYDFLTYVLFFIGSEMS